MAGHGGQYQEVVEPGDTQRAGPLQEEVEQVAGGQGIMERAVVGLMVEA